MTRIRLLANGRRLPFFDVPNLSSEEHPWAGYRFEEANGPTEPLPLHSWSKTTLLHVTGGRRGSLRWRHRGVWSTDAVGAGTVSVVRRDVEIQTAVPSASFPTMLLELDHTKLRHIAPEQVEAIDSSLVPVQVTNGDLLAPLMSAMCEEVRKGCPSGRLFGESISLALLAYLAGRYAALPQVICVTALSTVQKRRLVDCIRANLADNISVTELAALVQMSPAHFSRVFKASFGVTPYRFVMQERIEGARDMLASTKLSASQVAMAFGFSSQSHFAKVFRQFAGVTPKQFKAGG